MSFQWTGCVRGFCSSAHAAPLHNPTLTHTLETVSHTQALILTLTLACVLSSVFRCHSSGKPDQTSGPLSAPVTPSPFPAIAFTLQAPATS